MLGGDKCGAVNPEPGVCGREPEHAGAHIVTKPSWVDRRRMLVVSEATFERIQCALIFKAGHFSAAGRPEDSKAYIDSYFEVSE